MLPEAFANPVLDDEMVVLPLYILYTAIIVATGQSESRTCKCLLMDVRFIDALFMVVQSCALYTAIETYKLS